jgi:hypothetical protein
VAPRARPVLVLLDFFGRVFCAAAALLQRGGPHPGRKTGGSEAPDASRLIHPTVRQSKWNQLIESFGSLATFDSRTIHPVPSTPLILQQCLE